MGVASQIKNEIGCLWSHSFLLKGYPCSLPRIRVSVLVVDLDLHGNCFGELPMAL